MATADSVEPGASCALPPLVLPGPLLKELGGSVSRVPDGTIKDRLHSGLCEPTGESAFTAEKPAPAAQSAHRN